MKLISLKWFQKLVWWKSCIDYGRSITSWFNEIIIFIGGYIIGKNLNFWLGFLIVVTYILSCFVIGWLGFKLGLKEVETEIQNIYNPVAQDIRKKFKYKHILTHLGK